MSDNKKTPPVWKWRWRAIQQEIACVYGWFGLLLILLFAGLLTIVCFQLGNWLDSARYAHVEQLRVPSDNQFVRNVAQSIGAREKNIGLQRFLSEGFANFQPKRWPFALHRGRAAKHTDLEFKDVVARRWTWTVDNLPTDSQIAEGNVVSIVWFPTAKRQLEEAAGKKATDKNVKPARRVAGVLELSGAWTGDAYEIVARFRLLQKQGDKIKVWSGTEPDNGKHMLLRRGSYRIGLKPVAVLATERQIAERFFPQMERLGKLASISAMQQEPDEAAAYTRFIENALVQILGRKIAGPADKLSLANYQLLEEWTAWPRRLNGAGATGIIQFTTVFFFCIVIVTWLAHLRLVRAQLGDLVVISGLGTPRQREDAAIAGDFEEFHRDLRLCFAGHEPKSWRICRWQVSDPNPLHVLASGEEFERARNTQIAPFAVGATVFREMTIRGARGDAIDLLEQQAHHAAEVHSSNLTKTRFCVWAIPSIGFLGTVLGIGLALQGAGRVLSPDVAERQAVIQKMSASLGMAFDTTALALVLGLIAQGLLTFLARRYEQLIQGVRTAIIDLLQREHRLIRHRDETDGRAE